MEWGVAGLREALAAAGPLPPALSRRTRGEALVMSELSWEGRDLLDVS